MVGYEGRLIEGGWARIVTPEQAMLPYGAARELGLMRWLWSHYARTGRRYLLREARERAYNVRAILRRENVAAQRRAAAIHATWND